MKTANPFLVALLLTAISIIGIKICIDTGESDITGYIFPLMLGVIILLRYVLAVFFATAKYIFATIRKVVNHVG